MIKPINSTDKQNKNILPAGIAGGVGAALLSRVAPLSHFEHDRAFSKEIVSSIAQKVSDAKADEFTRIAKELSADEAFGAMTDVFTKNKDSFLNGAKEKLADATKNLDDTTKNAFEGFAKRIGDAGEYTKSLLDYNVVKNAKKSRPIAYFAAIGAAVAMTAAVVKNAIAVKKEKDESVSITYDKEGMIIDAPDSLALAIMLDETI